ncbi:hypothetical protein PG985_008105 [Apiospora marii]|uniref:Uncharacterized protein n=1 Tax=Apiospora marii TaxID=335849 RepID=A0ABR1R9E6_9PEZI
MYGPPEEDGYPDTPHKAAPSPHPNRGADHAPEVVESHGMEYNTAEHRSYPEAVAAAPQSRTPLPEYSSYHSGYKHGGYADPTKEGGGGGLEPPGSSHAVAISSENAAHKKRICGVSRLVFFALLSLLAVALVAVGLGVGLGVGLQHSHNSNSADADAASASSSASGASAVPSPTSTVTPGGSGNATCVAGLRYCGWDLIEQHHYPINLLQNAGSSDPYNDLYSCEKGNGIGWLEACGGAVQCQPPEHNTDGCDLKTRQSCCLPH